MSVEFRENLQAAISKPAPFLRLLCPLTAGILVEFNFPGSTGFLLIPLCISFISFIFWHYNHFSKSFRMQWIIGTTIQLVFFSLGRFVMHVHQDKQVEDSNCYDKTHANCLVIKILSDPVQKKNTYKCLARIDWIIKNQNCYYQNERILIYFDKNNCSGPISLDSRIVICKALRPIENLNSFNFDYKKYCHLKHIYAQVFLKENEFSILSPVESKLVLTFLDSLRKKLLVIVKERVPGKSENSFLEALMLGYTEDLDPGLLKSYANAGVIHIIAISGLHLALICQILELTLQKKGREKSGRWLKLVVIITCLWCYSLLSGASPSVIRAAGMFSLTLFARNIFRETNLYNTLAASAFLLLCFDPYWIFDTGFQLSYAAVLSLGLFSKPIQELLPLQNKTLRAIWSAISVSLSAQILTTPISIYYFHQFPAYFLIANLLAVPLSSLILVGGILLCICTPIHFLAQLIGLILEYLIKILNGLISYISYLPGAVATNLTLSLNGMILSYFIIFCAYRFVILKEKSWLFIALVAISIFQITRML